VIRVTLEPGELDEFGSTHDYTHTILQDENLVLATNLVKSHTTVPVPAVVHVEEGLTVLEMKEGIDLEQAWDSLSSRQLDAIKLELRSYIEQLRTIPNPHAAEFAVGTLCLTHELLFVTDPTYPHKGPFKTIEEYRHHAPGLLNHTPKFSKHAKPVFDHMDWYQSNIILTPNLDRIAAIIDWENAGFVPDPKDLHRGDVPIEEWSKPQWADILDGLDVEN